MRTLLLTLTLALGACSSEPTTSGAATSAAGSGGSGSDAGAGGDDAGPLVKRRLFVGTGEYNAVQNWHGILRFEDVSGSIDGPIAPSATIPIKETHDSAGVKLNFAHGFYVHEARDEIFASTLFTRADNIPCMMCNPQDPSETGSIAVLGGARTADGPQVVVRHLFGGDDPALDKTQIYQPHGVWVDEPRDLLYVANTFGKTLLVFEGASTVNGNVPPSRVVSSSALGFPVFAYVDSEADRLFVACMGAGPPMPVPSIAIFNGASTLDGDVMPNVRIAGPNTRLGAGNNQTTHNVWFDRQSKLLFVGHHTNEVLIFDLSAVDLDVAGPVVLDLAPRVLDVSASEMEIPNWSVYGLFFVPEDDALYVSTGFAMMGPKPGTPPNGVKVYEGVTSPSVSGRVPPAKIVTWTNGMTYFPPQPLWVTKY